MHYLIRGCTMISSLHKHNPSARVYVLCMDQATEEALQKIQLPNTTLISLTDFETPEYLAVKKSRTFGEYCWTCTAGILDYCLKTFQLAECTYLDADLYFFADPEKPLRSEVGHHDVLITPHHYSSNYEFQAQLSGHFCVQFMHFKNTQQGLIVLRQWKQQCLDWCYSRYEDGKFGDQKYLDVWPTEYPCVKVSTHFGLGVAPWNNLRFEFQAQNAAVTLSETHSKQSNPVIFYHFHGLRLFPFGLFDFSNYQIQRSTKNFIYNPYVQDVQNMKKRLKQINAQYPHADEQKYQLRQLASWIKRFAKGNFNLSVGWL